MVKTHFDFDFAFKIALIGDKNVGKRKISRMFAKEANQDGSQNFDYKRVSLENRIIDLRIHAQAPSIRTRFRAVAWMHYHNTRGFIIVYDITNQDSFKSVPAWIRNVETQASYDKVEMILVGNKCDDNEKRVVTYEEGKKLAEKYRMTFFETSVQTGKGIDEAFLLMTRQILSQTK